MFPKLLLVSASFTCCEKLLLYSKSQIINQQINKQSQKQCIDMNKKIIIINFKIFFA